MKHTIVERILIMQALLIPCHACNGIILNTEVSKGGTQLIQSKQEPHVISVSFGLPHLVGSEAVTLPDGRVYFLGGDSCGGVNTVKRFDPVTNTSTNATPMINARYLFGATVVGNQI